MCIRTSEVPPQASEPQGWDLGQLQHLQGHFPTCGVGGTV